MSFTLCTTRLMYIVLLLILVPRSAAVRMPSTNAVEHQYHQDVVRRERNYGLGGNMVAAWYQRTPANRQLAPANATSSSPVQSYDKSLSQDQVSKSPKSPFKGYVHEVVEETSTTDAPPAEQLPNQTKAEKTAETQPEEEDDEEHLKVFLPGQQAEWNSMIGDKGYKMMEQDWQLVNIVDKQVDKDGTTYGIQRGTLHVRVKADQLRKPKKAAQKHDAPGEDHREVDHAHAPQDLDHVDVMVPIAAPVGNRCLGKVKKLGKSWEESHTSALECRQWCELKIDCHFVSFSEADGCNMYSKCKKTGGAGYRTWMKLRALPAEADKARQAELLEDKYMELWSVSKNLNKGASSAPVVDPAIRITSDDGIEISDVNLRPGFFSSWHSQLFGMLLIGGCVAVFRTQRMTARMNMKAFQDGNGNISASSIIQWLQNECEAVLAIVTNKNASNANAKESQDRYDMEMSYHPVPEETKEVQLNFPKLAKKTEEPKDVTHAIKAAPEKLAEVHEEQDQAEDDCKPSIFKASQCYHQNLYRAQPGKNLKVEANASLKALMGK